MDDADRAADQIERELDENAPGRTEMGLLIYYGESVRPLNEGGLESQHEWLLDMEAQIKAAVVPGQGWRARLRLPGRRERRPVRRRPVPAR